MTIGYKEITLFKLLTPIKANPKATITISRGPKTKVPNLLVGMGPFGLLCSYSEKQNFCQLVAKKYFSQTDSLYLIKEGWVCVYKL